MGQPTQAQIDHINQHIDLFHNHAGDDRTPEEYLREYAYYKDGDIYERLCADLGLTPITESEGDTVTDTYTDVERAQMMLSLGMNEAGEPLSIEERSVLEQFVSQHGGASEAVQELAQEPVVTPGQPAEQAEQGGSAAPAGTPDLSALVQAEIQKALGGGMGLQPTSFEDVLKNLDPRDSDAALAMFEWLSANGRFGVVGTLNGGGYLLHYSEPKGTSKAGYTPGATQGGRMVDQAVEQARAAGAKPRETGMCDKCWSAVEKLDDGTVVSDDEHKNPVCSSGGAHTFNG